MLEFLDIEDCESKIMVLKAHRKNVVAIPGSVCIISIGKECWATE